MFSCSGNNLQVPLIAYSVGERGLISQLLSPKFGGLFVYGSLAGNPIPGLPSLESIQEAYKLEHVNADTKVFGLISKPVSHSRGPILHNPSFKDVNYNGIYVPMFVDDLKKFFSTYPSPDFSGFRYVTCCYESTCKLESYFLINYLILWFA